MKYTINRIKKIMIVALLILSMSLIATSFHCNAITYSSDGHYAIVNSSETSNGYTLKLSSVSGSAVGSLWEVTNGGPTTLKSKNSVKYVKENGTTVVYSGNNYYVSVESKSQKRTVSTSQLSGYVRLAKVEAAGYSWCINVSGSTVYINAYY